MEFKVELETDRSSLLVGHYDLPEKYKKRIWELELDRHHPITVCGKLCTPRRYTQFYSDNASGYGFSNSVAKAQPLPKFMKKLLRYVNETFDAKFNGILVNEYKSGTDYIGSHSDDEKELDPNTGVVALVLGQTRKFRIRDKKTKKIVIDVDVEDSHMVWMKGDFQKEFKHEIPPEKKRNGARRSLTFRYHEPSQDEPSQDEPSQDEPSQDEPSQDEPSQDEPSQDEPSQEEIPDAIVEISPFNNQEDSMIFSKDTTDFNITSYHHAHSCVGEIYKAIVVVQEIEGKVFVEVKKDTTVRKVLMGMYEALIYIYIYNDPEGSEDAKRVAESATLPDNTYTSVFGNPLRIYRVK